MPGEARLGAEHEKAPLCLLVRAAECNAGTEQTNKINNEMGQHEKATKDDKVNAQTLEQAQGAVLLVPSTASSSSRASRTSSAAFSSGLFTNSSLSSKINLGGSSGP